MSYQYTIIVTAIVALAVAGCRNSESQGIPSHGGEPFERMAVAERPLYLQTDERWGSDYLASTDDPMSSTGCTVCCMSMALAHYGININPGELNKRLRQHNGFNERGWLRWNAVEDLTKHRVAIDVASAPKYEVIDNAIRSGYPVIVRTLLNEMVQHWVLIVGKSGSEYIVKDPLVPDELVPLSDRGGRIYSVRIVKPGRGE